MEIPIVPRGGGEVLGGGEGWRGGEGVGVPILPSSDSSSHSWSLVYFFSWTGGVGGWLVVVVVVFVCC